MGRTSWFAAFLLGLCLSRLVLADDPVSIPPATTEQVQQSVDRAIGYLQTESAAWWSTRKCAACHHLPMPLWALGEADRQGYAIDKKYLADTTESLLGSRDKLMASKIFPNPADPPDPRPQGRGLNMGLPFLAVAARSMPSLEEGQKQSVKLIAEEIVKKQQPDGSWEFFATLRRPPINESQTTDAAWIIMALQGETGPNSPESQRAALSRAIAWLAAAKPTDIHQDKALKVLMWARSNKPRETIKATIEELLALQRTDGGWSQTVPELKSDAFATGQTLYVLSLAGYTAERPEIKRAVDFLVATQKPDGSWPMISRSTPDGSPGSSKLLTPITCAASSWATLGLARLMPKSVAERNAMKIPTKIAGAYSGGELVELRARDRIAYLIKPTGKVDPQRRWVWDFPFWLAINDGFGNVAHRYYVEKALAAGFHVAGVDVGPSCGSPAAAEVCQKIYEELVSKHGLHKRARVLAHSHGGLIAYGWAFRHPTCVDRIAGMCPATDFRTYPNLPNVVTGPTKGLDYGLSLEELDRRAGEFNPVENLAPLAKAGAKILHLHGDKDTLVPTGANSTELARRYRELGGEAEIVLLKDLGAGRANSRGHDGPELYESAPLLKFLLAD
jgi:Squalene-hopene cyclase C-terminal domain/Prenyltransferase and squalene oxidase repeat